MAAPLLIAAGGIGTALKVYGTYKAGKDRASLLERQGQLDRLRSEEIIRRARVNNDLLMSRAEMHMATQEVSFAGSGAAQSATTLAMMANTMNIAADQAILDMQEAQWEASAIRAGADSKDIAARQIKRASEIDALSEALFGTVSILSAMPGKEKPRSAKKGTLPFRRTGE